MKLHTHIMKTVLRYLFINACSVKHEDMEYLQSSLDMEHKVRYSYDHTIESLSPSCFFGNESLSKRIT